MNVSTLGRAAAFTLVLPLQAQLKPSPDFPEIQIPEGTTITQFASQNQVNNVTAICIDGQNRVYAAETHRWRVQVQDIRHGGKNNRYLRDRVNGDISVMTLEDRVAFHKKWSGKEPDFLKWEQFDDQSEVIKVLEDTTGDGKADKTTVFRGDFNEPLAGPSGGLIEKDGTVYFAMIPGVYSLRDLDGDGKAEEVKTLVNGFGVRVSFSGHDLNGFAFGPDGKLYWSIGDRGYHVEQDGKTFSRPDSGGVFRSNPDGSEFEEYYINLRNPKEIVFDDFGNLFTVDNDYDQGDRERIVYLVEHGDTGWRMGHQTLASFGGVAWDHLGAKPPRKEDQIDAWMNEGLWETRHDRQPAFVNPPIAYSVNGPCGFAYNPGVTTLPKQFDKNFFVVGYVASADRCMIENFSLNSYGAEFKLDKQEVFLKGIALTDIDWSYDGKLYISDYGGGWGQPNKGNIYAMAGDRKDNAAAIQEVKELFAKGFPNIDSKKLATLLDHADQRVRCRAQYALAERGTESLAIFQKALATENSLLRRIHGLWGIGQLAQKDPKLLSNLKGLLQDKEMEIRANTARVLGNHADHSQAYRSELIAALKDDSLRVRGLAAIALANAEEAKAVQPAIALLQENADKDVVLRHSGIMTLTKAAKASELAALNSHKSNAVRRAAVVALRRQKAPEISAFFDDKDEAVRQEAIRGAYDENIIGAYAALSERAHAIAKRVTPEVKHHPLSARRALHAAWTLARPQDLKVIVSIINDSSIDQRIRRDALTTLLDWNNPPVGDPVTGFARTLPKNRTKLPANLIEQLQPYFKSAPADKNATQLLARALKLVSQDKLAIDSSQLKSYLNAKDAPEDARLEALNILAPLEKKNPKWKDELNALVSDKSDKIRSRARSLLVFLNPGAQSLDLLADTLKNKQTTLAEKQLTIKTLGTIDKPEAGRLIADELKKLTAGKLDAGLALDVVMAAEASKSPQAKKALADFRAKLPKDDAFAEWTLLCETGGDLAKGKAAFYGHGIAQCQRCHTMHGVGADVGPELGAIGKNNDAKYLLRSLVHPTAEVAEGFGIGTVTLKDGTAISGTILTKDAKGNTRVKIEKDITVIAPDKIASQTTPVSAMPPMAGILNKEEMRDMVAFLLSCKEDKTDDEHK
ncbi:HEAT repeat domain-containing protein [Akkermansiaceae bacterium]|nr:HEAT repeat domain-containing protein [Akkermansiaceae bacterium]